MRTISPDTGADNWWWLGGGWWWLVSGWWSVVVGCSWWLVGGWWVVGGWWLVVGGDWLVVGWWLVGGWWVGAPAQLRRPSDPRAYIRPLGEQQVPRLPRKSHRHRGGDNRLQFVGGNWLVTIGWWQLVGGNWWVAVCWWQRAKRNSLSKALFIFPSWCLFRSVPDPNWSPPADS